MGQKRKAKIVASIVYILIFLPFCTLYKRSDTKAEGVSYSQFRLYLKDGYISDAS